VSHQGVCISDAAGMSALIIQAESMMGMGPRRAMAKPRGRRRCLHAGIQIAAM